MKAKLSYKSKRNIIIAGIIAILLVGISTAGYFYIKGNDDTAKAFTEKNTVIGENTPNTNQENLNLENPQNNNGQTTTPGGTEENNPQNQGGTTNEGTTNPGTTSTGTSSIGTTGEVPNEDYVTQTIERVEALVSEDYVVEWQPISVQANTTTRNLSIIRPIITANKTADKTAVVVGETITYTITVQNKGNADGGAIVKDNIPEGTTFVEGSINVNNEATQYTAEDLSNGIQVNVAKQNEQGENGKAVISFQVVVNENSNLNVIENKATVNETIPTEEVKNPVVTYSKQVDKTGVKAGEELTYTITVTNASEVDGTAIVKDSIPEGTTFVEGSIKINDEETNYTAENLANGIEVKVAANKEATVEFKVTANDLNDGDKITNTAYVNEKPVTSEETEYQEPVISAEKEANKTAVVAGEELTYTITVKNTGRADGKAKVQDNIPEGTTFVEGSIKINDEETNYTAENLANGIEVNVSKVNENGEAGKATVSFKVTVNNDATETLKNKATINETISTEEVKNPVVTYSKQVDKTEVKYGEELTYTITVTNASEVDGTVVVKDSAPVGTEFVENGNVTVTIDGETTTKAYSELEAGFEVTVPAGKEATVEFKVTVNNDATETIKNTAYVNDKTTDEIPTKIESKIIFVENVGTDVADLNGYAGEVIEDTTMPTTTKVGYTFAGWYAEETLENQVTVLPAKYPAGTTYYYAKWTPNTDTAYTVKHHLQNLDGTTYTLADTEAKTGTTGEQTQAQTKTYEGFTAPKTVEQKTIVADGSTVVDIYYTRNSYTITYKIVGDYFATDDYAHTTYKYGETVTEEAEPTQTGYTFVGWENVPTTMPANDVVATGYYTPNTDTAYTVKHHLQNLDGTTYTLADTEVKTGTTGEQTQAQTKAYEGFTTPETVEQKTIAADGSTVVDIYYTRNSYTITYKIVGDYFATDDYAHTTYKYGETVTAEAEPTQKGYTFSGWSEIPETMPANDVVVEGSYTANDDTVYTVEYYYQVQGNYAETTEKVVTRTGTTESEVSVTNEDKIPDIEGYVYDEEKSNTVNQLTGIIEGDGSLVLKVYFKQQFKVEYVKGNYGDFETQTYITKYGEKTPEFKGEKTGNSGYYFAGWDKEVEETVTGDITYTALWEGLEIEKTRTAIEDKDNLGNTTYVDQEGDIIKYTIKVTNTGDVKVKDIILKDNYDVTVTSIKLADTTLDITSRNNDFNKNQNLLKDIIVELDKNESIEVTVEHTVKASEVTEALKADKKIINTATATLNDHNYTATDETEGKEGTEVKQRCEYRVEYYFNGKINDEYTVKSATVIGANISFDKPETKDGYSYIKFIGFDGKDNGSQTTTEGTNIIKVYYGKAETSIQKDGDKTVDAGRDIEYKITVKNTGYEKTTIKVTDELQGTTYVTDSATVDGKAINPTITKNGDNQVLSFDIELPAASDDNKTVTRTIIFKAKTPIDAYGEKIQNIAKVIENNVETSSNTIETAINENTIKYSEFTEGQKGKDLNIIFILDNSSSMNYPIEGKSYTRNNSEIAPTDISKTRLYNAKEAINSFIQSQNNKPNTSMSVITFNTEDTSTTRERTLINSSDITEKTIQEETQRWINGYFDWEQKKWIEGHYETYTATVTKKYATVNGTEYEVSDRTRTGSDGEQYYYVNETILTGARLIGNNSTSNNDLKEKVTNISISSQISGFGTNIEPAYNLINNNENTYISSTKKNIVIILADGKFNDNYNGEALETLKGNVDEIYSIGFGSGRDFDSNSLKAISTNNKCYTASNSSTLLDVFNEIEETATGTEKTKKTTNGVVALDEASKTIEISENCPIVATYDTGKVDENGNAIKETLFTCTSKNDLSTYGLSLENGDKVIKWNIKTFIQNNPDITIPSTVYIKYYVPRTSSNS